MESVPRRLWGIAAAMVLPGCWWAQVQVQLQPVHRAGQILSEDFDSQPLEGWLLSGGAQVATASGAQVAEWLTSELTQAAMVGV